MSVFSNPVRYITTTQALADFCAAAEQEPFITVDTEFVREKTYWPVLCLVQIGLHDQTALIDTCVGGLDLSPLQKVLANPDCVKVFHAARQDLEIFFHLFGELPKNIFDTQIAARAEGLGDQIGYDALVSALTNGHIDKSHRFTDWSKRPLSEEQKRYAVADVTHLRLAYQALLTRLKQKNRLTWLKEDFEHLEQAAFLFPKAENLWEKIPLRAGGRRAMGILRALAAWREETAQQEDVPRQRIIRDEVLAQTAIIAPKNVTGLLSVRGFPPKLAQSAHGQALLKLIAQEAARPESELPSPKERKNAKMTPQRKLAAQLLGALLEVKALEHSVSPKVIAGNADLAAFVEGERDLDMLKGWRFELFGKAALNLLEGKLALQIENEEVKAVKVS